MSDRGRLYTAAALWVLGALFVTLALLAVARDTLPGDVWLTRRVQEVEWTPWVRAMDYTEDLAQMPLVAFTTAAAGLALLLVGPASSALLLVLTFAPRPLVPALKEIIERPRPTADQVTVAPGQPADFSFPSGHAFTALLVYGLLFYLAGAHIRVRWLRLGVQGACLWVIAVTGVERVYSGAHWPSDVLGGFLLAAIVLGVFVAAHRVVSKPRES